MSTEKIIIIVAVVIVGLILITIISKIIIKVLIFLVVAGVVCYFLFFRDGGVFNTFKNGQLIYDLQAEYCIEKFDTVKCECIIYPLLRDLEDRYKPEELEELSKDPLKMTEVLVRLISENRGEIKTCLKERDADYAWDDFIKDIRSLKIGDKLKEGANQLMQDHQ